MRSGIATRCFPGEALCGDVAAVWPEVDGLWFAIADGLGHGPDAHVAARDLVAIVAAERGAPAERLVKADVGLRASRGAAAAIGHLDRAAQRLTLVAAGNIHGLIDGLDERRFEGAPGIVGGRLRPPRPVEFAFPDDGLVILWTDGLSDVTLDSDLRRLRHAPDALATRLLEQFGRGTDDGGVLCVAGMG